MIADQYPGATAAHVEVTNGGSERITSRCGTCPSG